MEDPLINLEKACQAYQCATQCGLASALLFTVYLIGQMGVVITAFVKEGLHRNTLTAVETACLVPAGAGIMFLAAAVRLDTKAAKPYVMACLYICIASIVLPLILLCMWS